MDLSVFINYELVFVSLYHLVCLHSEETGSEKLALLAKRLKEAGKALFNQEYKNDQIAKDFFKHAPKIFYTFDTAYTTMEAFLERHAKEWGVEDLAELVKNRDEDILKTYHKILGV